MNFYQIFFLLLNFKLNCVFGTLPTNYEYYTNDGINSGLSADQPDFMLNGKNISIYGGTMHYFRVPRQYWRDRLRKMRAAGLNTIETYIAWNLHEYEQGSYDFGGGGSEMEDFLYLDEFLEIIKEEDLFAIIRPGPYICSEFEYGGFPSFILRNNSNIKLRTTDEIYMKFVSEWFKVLLPHLSSKQFAKGGPIIAMQVENEYGNFETPELEYMKSLRKIIIDNGINQTLLVSSDNPTKGFHGTISELFATGNFNTEPKDNLDALKEYQPNRPVMAMEYWDGWNDYWGEDRNNWYNESMLKQVYEIILKYPASVNIYMFHGGTNWGFLSGANSNTNNSEFEPVTTSYDYGAALNEAGDYTEKYNIIKNLLQNFTKVKTKLPEKPDLQSRVAYPSITVTKKMSFYRILENLKPQISGHVIPMEQVDINNNSGQKNGYIVYRKEMIHIKANAELKITGHLHDTVMVLVNGKLVSPVIKQMSDLNKFGAWRFDNSTLILSTTHLMNATIDLIVENWGRVHWGFYQYQYKGLWQDQEVLLNETILSDWKIYSLEFKKNWTNNLQNWENNTSTNNNSPTLYKFELVLNAEPSDTYVDMTEWIKGIVMVNGFVLGRYTSLGEQRALYLPAPFLRNGINDIIVFDHFSSVNILKFSSEAIYKKNNSTSSAPLGCLNKNIIYIVSLLLFTILNII